MFEALIAKLAGKFVGQKLKLEDSMDTPWYKNRSTLSHLIAGLVGVSGIVVGVLTNDFHVAVNPVVAKVGSYLLTFLAAVGIYDNHVA